MNRSVIALATYLLIGCSADERTTHDLVALYDRAQVVHETSRVDFGTDDAREVFLFGFSENELGGDGVGFVWSDGPESGLRISLREPRELRARFRCWPFGFEGAPPQTVSVELNGNDVGDVSLSGAPGEYEVSLPVAHQHSGENWIRFRYGYTRAPRDVLPGAADGRRLAVAWDWLSFDGAIEPEEPLVGGAGRTAAMSVPPGTRVDYFVHAEPQSVIAFESVRSEEGGAILITAETLTEVVEKRIDVPARRVHAALPSGGGLTRISIQTLSSRAVLREPVVATRARRSTPDAPSAVAERRPNVVLYLIDTLRADHIGAYGYDRPTPAIDRVAADGTVYERALAQSSWTRPATASILTGLHPRAHTANERDDALPKSVPTLAERLSEFGYETAGFIVNTNVSAPFGFDRGFDTFELLLHEDGILGARGDQLMDRTLQWLGERTQAAPVFLYVHATDPHDPYGMTGFHREGFGSVPFMQSLDESGEGLSSDELDRLIALYDEDVAFADAQLGRLIDALESQGLYRDSIIIIVSDHGEEFGEHGRWRHGKTLYGEQLDIPLVIKWPDGAAAGTRVPDVVQQIDITPTVLDYLGAGAERLPGRSLWRLLDGPATPAPPVISYLNMDGRELESVVVDGQKLVRYQRYDREAPPYELFDVGTDRLETENRASDEPRKARFLEAYLRSATPTAEAAPESVPIDETVERQLRALGYVR